MVEKDDIFQEKVKNSFLKVKEEINSLKIGLEGIKGLLLEIKGEKYPLNDQKNQNIKENPELSQNLPNIEKVPQEIMGSNLTNNKQTLNKHLTNNKQTLNKQTDYDALDGLSKKELLVYLTIFQLQDEEQVRPTYAIIAEKLKMSQTSIRLKVMNILKKEVPLEKRKINNQTIALTIPGKFLNPIFKQNLIKTYYSKDPSQINFH